MQRICTWKWVKSLENRTFLDFYNFGTSCASPSGRIQFRKMHPKRKSDHNIKSNAQTPKCCLIMSINRMVCVWHIMGTFFAILFAIIGTKFDNCGTKFVEISTKYNPEVIKYRPLVNKYTPRRHFAPPRGVFGHKGSIFDHFGNSGRCFWCVSRKCSFPEGAQKNS